MRKDCCEWKYSWVEEIFRHENGDGGSGHKKQPIPIRQQDIVTLLERRIVHHSFDHGKDARLLPGAKSPAFARDEPFAPDRKFAALRRHSSPAPATDEPGPAGGV